MVVPPTHRTRAGGKRQAPPPKPAQKLTTKMLLLCYVGIPLAIVAFAIGACGMAVLMDEPDRKQWYSITQFADTWRWLTEKNPFYTTLCFNGGMVTVLMLGAKLLEHRRALREEKALQAKVKARKAQ